MLPGAVASEDGGRARTPSDGVKGASTSRRSAKSPRRRVQNSWDRRDGAEPCTSHSVPCGRRIVGRTRYSGMRRRRRRSLRSLYTGVIDAWTRTQQRGPEINARSRRDGAAGPALFRAGNRTVRAFAGTKSGCRGWSGRGSFLTSRARAGDPGGVLWKIYEPKVVGAYLTNDVDSSHI